MAKSHIEQFLHTKAIEFIDRRWCSVYLLLNEDDFINKSIKVEGYFTLSHKAMTVADNLSKTKVQKISGFKTAEALHFVLIGQLGKYIDEYNKMCSCLTAQDIVDEACAIIEETSEIIPCRCIMVECNDYVRNKGIYESCDFKYLQNDGDHNQYYKIL